MTSQRFEITRSALAQIASPSEAYITDVEQVASYSWIEGQKATIAIPGCPSRWAPIGAPKRLQKDSGMVYIAQNAARHPESPMEPLFRAISIESPSFDVREIDIVTDRNNIRKLLSFINPAGSKNGLEAFTIHTEVAEDTVLFCREEKVVKEFIQPHEFRGYGHAFEEAYTTNEVPASTGHHRMIKYRFGRLTLLIRHETDGYVSDQKQTSCAVSTKDDDLSALLENLAITPPATPLKESAPRPKLQLKEAGHKVPIESTLEIKTRVAHKLISLDEVAPQLWVSQTPRLVRAYYVRGEFRAPVVEDVSEEIKQWEKRNQNDLKTLANLLGRIVESVKLCGRAIVKYQPEEDRLTIVGSNLPDMLPKDLYQKWARDDKVEIRVADGERIRNAEVSAPLPTAIDVNRILTSVDHTQGRLGDGTVDTETTIQVGQTTYSIPLLKVPYLLDLVASSKNQRGSVADFKHEPIAQFDVAISGLKSGYRQCFRLLNADVKLFEELCATYDKLEIDVLEGKRFVEIAKDIRAGRYDHESEMRRDKRLARDSAFRLVYAMISLRTESYRRDRNGLYNAVLYVTSHPGCFKSKVRCVVDKVYRQRLQPSLKQVVALNRWKTDEVTNEDDETTEYEDFYQDSFSDWSGGYFSDRS